MYREFFKQISKSTLSFPHNQKNLGQVVASWVMFVNHLTNINARETQLFELWFKNSKNGNCSLVSLKSKLYTFLRRVKTAD